MHASVSAVYCSVNSINSANIVVNSVQAQCYLHLWWYLLKPRECKRSTNDFSQTSQIDSVNAMVWCETSNIYQRLLWLSTNLTTSSAVVFISRLILYQKRDKKSLKRFVCQMREKGVSILSSKRIDRGPVWDRSYHRDIDVCEIEHGSAHHLGHGDVMMVMVMWWWWWW